LGTAEPFQQPSHTRATVQLPVLASRFNQEERMNRDELNGKAEKVKGKLKQAAGDLTDDERLHDEGVADEAAGDVQDKFGRGRRKIGEAIEDIGEDLKR
jgi:uncharacterized protein YjbJ (UPF0337 family)